MPDWNPAEIIGVRPSPLAFSLYRWLITDDVWATQRAEFGYRDVRPHPLIVGFCGQPYVDIRASFPLHQRFNCEGVSVWITHIGGYPGRYNRALLSELNKNPPRLFICGHSHILKVMPDKKRKLLHMNPGAIGKHGFHTVRTMLRFQIDGKEIQHLEVIEIPR